MKIHILIILVLIVQSSSDQLKYLGKVTCNRAHISSSLRELSPCKPREKVIALEWPNNTSADRLTPSHVTVLRCSGGCLANYRSCVASKKSTRQVAVMLGSCRNRIGGRCEKECTNVQVEDEVVCECGCRRKAEDCRANQEYQSETCECECRDKEAMKKCLEEGTNRIWDASKCECVCSHKLQCTHENSDKRTCQCKKDEIINDSDFALQTLELDIMTYITWEHYMIGFLAVLLVPMIIITLILIARLRRLQAVHLNSSTHTPSSICENLYSECPIQKRSTVKEFNSSYSDISSFGITDSSLYSDSLDSQTAQDRSKHNTLCSNHVTSIHNSITSVCEHDSIKENIQANSFTQNFEHFSVGRNTSV